MEKQLRQRQQEENLQRREQELDAREFELLSREINIMMTQNTPTPKKRRGKFSKSRLKLLKREPGQISLPLDFRHQLTVLRDDARLRSDTPPGSPAIPRLRAIARMFYSLLFAFHSFIHSFSLTISLF